MRLQAKKAPFVVGAAVGVAGAVGKAGRLPRASRSIVWRLRLLLRLWRSRLSPPFHWRPLRMSAIPTMKALDIAAAAAAVAGDAARSC